MSVRRAAWIAALVTAALVAIAIPWPPDLKVFGPVVVVALTGLLGMGVEMMAAMIASEGRRTPRDARPADGRVGVATVRGVSAKAIGPKAPVRSFVALKDEEPREDSRPRAGRPVLLGRVVVLSLFVGRDGQSWSDEEIAEADKALRQAGTWIEKEAGRWGATVNVDLADTVFVADDPETEDVEITFVLEGGHQAPFEARAMTKALASASRAAARLGFTDIGDLVARIGPRVEADERVWLLHLRRAGRSMALSEEESAMPGVNVAVCYAREENMPEPLAGPPFADPVTFVHELMHLFGASDKYGVPLKTFPSKTVTDRDVMLLHWERLSRLRIDPLTAKEIGWEVRDPAQGP